MVNTFRRFSFPLVCFAMLSYKRLIVFHKRDLQVGIGLLILQQLSGINGVLFYSSTIFEDAGKHVALLPSHCCEEECPVE